MNVLDNIKESIRLLDEVENKVGELNTLLSQTDKKIDFWLHRIELENIPVTHAYKILKEIKKQRLIRRKCKNELKILATFKAHEGKLCNSGNRQILLTQVCKTDKNNKNAEYSYDAYSEDEAKEIYDLWLIYGKESKEENL